MIPTRYAALYLGSNETRWCLCCYQGPVHRSMIMVIISIQSWLMPHWIKVVERFKGLPVTHRFPLDPVPRRHSRSMMLIKASKMKRRPWENAPKKAPQIQAPHLSLLAGLKKPCTNFLLDSCFQSKVYSALHASGQLGSTLPPFIFGRHLTTGRHD